MTRKMSGALRGRRFTRGGDGLKGVKLGEAHCHQQVLGQDKAQRRGDIFPAISVVRRDRHRNGEGFIFILQAAGEFDLLQLLARRDVDAIIGAGLADLLIGRIAEVHPDRFAARLMFRKHRLVPFGGDKA